MANPQTQPSTPTVTTLGGRQPPAEQATEHKERKFKVLKTTKIPNGGGSFTLQAGKVVSTHGYDIEMLKSRGAELQELTS